MIDSCSKHCSLARNVWMSSIIPRVLPMFLSLRTVAGNVKRVGISTAINDKNTQRAITLISSVRPRNL